MKRRVMFACSVLGCALLLCTVSPVSASWDQMEVLKQDFDISVNPPRDQWYAEVEYNSIDNEFMVIWRSSGPIREDCEPGDDYECTGMFHSMDAQRVSPDGTLLDEMIQLIPPDEGYKNGARFAHNMYTNEYMTAHPVSPSPSSLESEILIGRINNLGEIQSGLTSLYPGNGGESPLPEVIFNPVRKEYLVVYSDRDILTPPGSYLNLIGFILDEDGNPLHGPFPVGNQEGDYYAPDGAYNPDDDTYLIVWEDFRNVPDWLFPCDVYGALIDAEDGTMIKEIAVIDDFALGEPEAGDQRVPVVAYNPDKKKFFVVWEADEMPSVDDSAIFARYVNGDGTLEPIIDIVDAPRQQHWPDVVYVEEEQKFFVTWNDLRNDGLPKGSDWYTSPAIDVYARWLDDTGNPIGDEILIAEREGSGESWKQVPRMAYNPVEKRFLIAWYNRHAAGGDTPFGGAPSDVKATLYGMPPFLTMRVVESGTDNPVEDAWALVIGPSLVAFEKTNVEGEGWFNIEDNSPSTGTYLVMVFKLGCTMAIKFVNYAGSPLQETVEVVKLW